MCPLRFILAFLSAIVAGFFVMRNLTFNPDLENLFLSDSASTSDQFQDQSTSPAFSSKAVSAAASGFWTFIDMASGRYLWRTFVSYSSSTA
ncbi:unnamed protein product [Prunus armeniaca]|uniref:Methyltransferase-related protein n=1 Tax=Prunus armeniaca TaxID=36596 RepID=A0A6J5XU37_PRUAR|nr:unnamed protein product [Prunus armeniaca]